MKLEPKTGELPDRALDPDVPVPFEEVVLPFVQLARSRLLGESQQTEGISPAALALLDTRIVAPDR